MICMHHADEFVVGHLDIEDMLRVLTNDHQSNPSIQCRLTFTSSSKLRSRYAATYEREGRKSAMACGVA